MRVSLSVSTWAVPMARAWPGQRWPSARHDTTTTRSAVAGAAAQGPGRARVSGGGARRSGDHATASLLQHLPLGCLRAVVFGLLAHVGRAAPMGQCRRGHPAPHLAAHLGADGTVVVQGTAVPTDVLVGMQPATAP